MIFICRCSRKSHVNLLQIFKMWNKELYVREQQDAYEFFTSLVDQLDEHLKVQLAH